LIKIILFFDDSKVLQWNCSFNWR